MVNIYVLFCLIASAFYCIKYIKKMVLQPTTREPGHFQKAEFFFICNDNGSVSV